jgi:uncharacterized protein (TIGR02996 family)
MVPMDPLLDAIAAAPDDDGPRLVYADRLIADGDPRGELIALQCAGEDASELLEKHGNRWLAELGLREGEGTWQRGFVESVSIIPARAASVYDALVHQPTLRSIHVDGPPSDAGTLTEQIQRLGLPPALRSLQISVEEDRQSIRLDGDAVSMRLGDPVWAGPVLASLDRWLRRGLTRLAIELRPGRFLARPLIDTLIARPNTLRSLAIGIEPVQERVGWMMPDRRLGKLLASQPSLESLELPMIESSAGALVHDSLRALHLRCVRLSRGSGGWGLLPSLELLDRLRLPALRRLTLDFSCNQKYPPSILSPDALTAADFPSLEELVIASCPDAQPIITRLVRAPFGRRLRRLELVGTVLGDGAALALADARLPAQIVNRP